jgi:hypothetical protein
MDEKFALLNRYSTPGQKLAAAGALNRSARALKEAYLRQQKPDWPEEKLKRAVRDWMLYARA